MIRSHYKTTHHSEFWRDNDARALRLQQQYRLLSGDYPS